MTAPLGLEPIGVIRTSHSVKAATPVQTALNPDEIGRVVLHEPFRPGLLEIDGFDYVWLLTWLARNDADPVPPSMQQVPFLLTEDRRQIGLFAMRGPRRPNPIGLHMVRIVDVLDDGFEFAGVDMLDGTPVLDIKPWVAQLDQPHGHAPDAAVRSGWFDRTDLSGPHTPDSLRSRRTDALDG